MRVYLSKQEYWPVFEIEENRDATGQGVYVELSEGQIEECRKWYKAFEKSQDFLKEKFNEAVTKRALAVQKGEIDLDEDEF